MENFTGAKQDYDRGTPSRKVPRTGASLCVCVCVCVCVCFKQDCTLNEVLLTVTKSRFASTRWWAIVTLCKIKKECSLLRSCLMGARRMLCFTAEQVFLPMKEVWLMPNCKIHSAQQRGGKKPKGREKNLCLYFFWSCHRLWILLYETHAYFLFLCCSCCYYYDFSYLSSSIIHPFAFLSWDLL